MEKKLLCFSKHQCLVEQEHLDKKQQKSHAIFKIHKIQSVICKSESLKISYILCETTFSLFFEKRDKNITFMENILTTQTFVIYSLYRRDFQSYSFSVDFLRKKQQFSKSNPYLELQKITFFIDNYFLFLENDKSMVSIFGYVTFIIY